MLDLKTGHTVGTGWIQVGGYIRALSQARIVPNSGAILHVPRRSWRDQYAETIEYRSGGPLVESWNRWHARVNGIRAGGVATETPGYQCKDCTVGACYARSEG